MLREHAEEQHYVFAGPVSIDFTQEDDLVTGRFRVRSQATAQVDPATPAAAAAPQPAGRRARSRSTAAPTRSPRPGWSSGAAPRPTCASTTPASAAGTPSSG